MMRKILLFSDIELPDSCAGASRVINLAKLFRDAGNDICVIGITNNPSEKGKIHEYNGVRYSSLYVNNSRGIKAISRINDTRTQIIKYLRDSKSFDAILLTNIYFDYARVFLRYSKKSKTPLIVNAVEWYDRSDISFKGLLGPVKFLKNRIALRYFYPKFKNIIGISSLLCEYYSKKGCNTIRIPTILDMSEYEGLIHSENKKIVIAYAGIPAKKDLVINGLNALYLLNNSELSSIEFHLYGPTENQIKELGFENNFSQEIGRIVYCHGKVPHNEVKEYIASADYTFLLRPNKRYANAGFPTKIAESFACATPVITNITSDLSLYVKDGITGVVVDKDTTDHFAKAISHVLETEKADMNRMRNNAKKIAEEAFSYKSYIEQTNLFLEQIDRQKV